MATKLNKLRYEWLNYYDKDGSDWLSLKQGERELNNIERAQEGKPPGPPMTLEEQERWRRHIAAVHEIFDSLEGIPPYILCLRLASPNAIVRRADNPLFAATLLRLLDTRAVSIEHLEHWLDISKGHIYRFLKRSGVLLRSLTRRALTVASDAEGLYEDLNYFALPSANAILVRDRIVPFSPSDMVSFDLDRFYDPRLMRIPLPPKQQLRSLRLEACRPRLLPRQRGKDTADDAGQ